MAYHSWFSCFTFLVLSIAPGLSDEDYEQAIAWGPPFVEADADYATMLERAGWQVSGYQDLSQRYLETTRAMERSEEENRDALIALHGADGYEMRVANSRNRQESVLRGLIRREQFSAVPAF